MPAASRPHRRVGIAGATLLALALAILLALPAPAARAEGETCASLIGAISFTDATVEGPLAFHAVDELPEGFGALRASLRQLIDDLQADLGNLPDTEICLVPEAELPTPDGPFTQALKEQGAAAKGATAVVAVVVDGLSASKLAETVATGLIHVALFQASEGPYPAEFARDVTGWYMEQHSADFPEFEPAQDPRWAEVDWDASLLSIIGWDPGEGYAYSGSLARTARAKGVDFATPDVSLLRDLATSQATETPFPWFYVGVGALGAVFVASLTWLLIRRRRPVVTSAALPGFLQPAEAPPEPEPEFDTGQATGLEAIAPPPITAPLPVVPPAPVMEPVPIPETPLPAPVPVSRVVRASASQPARPPAAPLLGEGSPSSEATGPIAAWETYAPHSIAVDSGVLNDFEVRAAAVIGAKNRLGGIPCQDAFALAQAGGRYLVTAVCDGVGSARLSHLGAQAVAEHMVARVAAALDGGGRLDHLDAGALVGAAGDTIRALAEGHPEGLTVRDFATTLALIAVDTQAGPQEPALLAIRVGDSTVRLLDANGDWVDLFGGAAAAGPGEDSLLSTATVALPCDPAHAQSACVAWWAGSPVVAMTDGLANPMRDSAQVRAHFKGSWSTPPDPLHFAADLSFRRRGALDDRTAVAIWRPVGLEEPPRD